MTVNPRLARASLALVLASLASLSSAQGSASAAKKELVQKVIQQQQGGFEALSRALTEQPLAQMSAQLRPLLQTRVAAEQREAVGKDIQAEFVKYADEVGPIIRDKLLKSAPAIVGPILEEKLSEDELRQVVQALESPGFRKFVSLEPEMQRQLTEKLVADLQTQITPKLKTLELAIGKRLNLPAPAAAAAAPAAAPRAAASGAKK